MPRDIVSPRDASPGRVAVSPWFVEDFFTDPNGTTPPNHIPDIDVIGGGWTDVIAGATIQSNRLSDGSAARQAVIDAGQFDVEVNSRITVSGGGASENGLTFRYQDASNYLWAGVDLLWQTTRIYRVVAGTPTEIGGAANFSESYANGQLIFARIVAVGTSISLYIDGIQKGTPTESNFQNETEHGIYSNHVAECTWDDFRVGRVLR